MQKIERVVCVVEMNFNHKYYSTKGQLIELLTTRSLRLQARDEICECNKPKMNPDLEFGVSGVTKEWHVQSRLVP